jgi:azobenzene reductase
MVHIPVLLGSVRNGRKSEVVAKYLVNKIASSNSFSTTLIDLKELNLPVMEERVRMDPNAAEGAVFLSSTLAAADGLIIVSPEYHWCMPGALKNALDFIGPELQRKPVALVSVSSGVLGGMQLAVSFRAVVASMGAYLVPQLFPVTKVSESFDKNGVPTDPMIDQRANKMLVEIMWLAEAVQLKRQSENQG